MPAFILMSSDSSFHFLAAKYLHDLSPYLVVLTLGKECQISKTYAVSEDLVLAGVWPLCCAKLSSSSSLGARARNQTIKLSAYIIQSYRNPCPSHDDHVKRVAWVPISIRAYVLFM